MLCPAWLDFLASDGRMLRQTRCPDVGNDSTFHGVDDNADKAGGAYDGDVCDT